MRNYIAFYQRQRIELQAASSFAAQQAAAKVFKARKAYDVLVVLADVPVNTASL